jgi:streptomycin 6-kinase
MPESLLLRISEDQIDAGWVADLPRRVNEVAHRNQLELGEVFQPGGHTSWVARATQRDGTEVVVKVVEPHHDGLPEPHVLSHWNGIGAIRILAHEPDLMAYVLESVRPGIKLGEIDNENERCNYAVNVMGSLRRDPAPALNLPTWKDKSRRWLGEFSEESWSYPASFARAMNATRLLLPRLIEHADTAPDFVLHGDLHSANILLSGRGWVAIDPKGCTGPAEAEAVPFVRDPMHWKAPRDLRVPTSLARAERVANELGLDHELLLAWTQVIVCEMGCRWATARGVSAFTHHELADALASELGIG